MSGHTKGEWSVDDMGNIVAAGRFIAEPCYDDEVMPLAESEANAALLAAAKIMLEALQYARIRLAGCAQAQGHAEEVIADLLAPIDAAIAKAECKP